MATRILGPTGSRRRRRFLLGPILLVALVALLLTAGAQAVHDDGFFELGPGANTTPATPEQGITNILGSDHAQYPGPDWADLFTGTCAGGTCAFRDTDNDGIPDFQEVFGGHAAGFIADASSAGGAEDPTTFSGFGTSNKNNDAISDEDCLNRDPPLTGSDCAPWGWDSGNVPAKDDLTNVYSYEKINDANGHLLLYAGVEREDPSGSSHVDIEYFQDTVTLGTPDNFNGVRTVNDVIVVMDFLRGGGLGSVSIRRWDGDEYVQVGLAGGQGCFAASGGVGDDICAFNNGATINGGPWPNFDNHGALITNLEANAFTEIGVDLTELIGASPCISTFMGKTRSSASFTAELKDFAGPQNFDVCQPSTDLNASATATQIHSGDSVTITLTETNDGNETLLNPMVTANNGCTPAGVDADNNGFNDGDTDEDGKLDPGETWTFTCTITPAADTTVTAIASGVGELSGKTVTACTDPDDPPPNTICDQDEQAEVSIDVISPGTNLVKTASATVTYSYAESNDGDVALDGPSVSDDHCSPVVGVDANNDTFNDGDTNEDGKLDTTETWLFTCTTAATSGDVDVTNIGTGTATDPLGFEVTACTDPTDPPDNTICDQGERDSVRVQVTHN